MNQVLNLTFILQDSMLIPRSKKSWKKHPVATAYTVIIKAQNCSQFYNIGMLLLEVSHNIESSMCYVNNTNINMRTLMWELEYCIWVR